jgi:hypothetical protein
MHMPLMGKGWPGSGSRRPALPPEKSTSPEASIPNFTDATQGTPLLPRARPSPFCLSMYSSIHLFICSSIRLSIHQTATTGITVLGGPTTNASQPPRRTRRRRAADHTRRAGDCEMWLSLTGPATMDHACHSRSRSPEGAGARVGGVQTFREPLGVPAYAPCCASPTPCLLVHVPCLKVSMCSTLSPPRCG